MLKKLINKHPVANFFAQFIVSFAFADAIIMLLLAMVLSLHLL